MLCTLHRRTGNYTSRCRKPTRYVLQHSLSARCKSAITSLSGRDMGGGAQRPALFKKSCLPLQSFRGHGQLDMFSEQEINKKLMLERFQAMGVSQTCVLADRRCVWRVSGTLSAQHLVQEEHPGFDFSGASFSGQAPSARHQVTAATLAAVLSCPSSCARPSEAVSCLFPVSPREKAGPSSSSLSESSSACLLTLAPYKL